MSWFYCSPSVSSSYLLCTPRTQGGACRLSTECCPVSFVPSPARTLHSWSHLPCSQRYQRTAWTMSSRLLATLAASSISCPRLLEQSLPCNCHCLIVSQSAPAQSPFLPCMQISQERKDGSLLPGPHLLSCKADTQARCEDVGALCQCLVPPSLCVEEREWERASLRSCALSGSLRTQTHHTHWFSGSFI